MIRNILLFIAIAVVAISCSNSSKNTAPIRKELPMANIIADSLFTQFPGTLQVTSNHILLQTPFDKDGFLKIYDRKTGKEIDWIGKIGRGPGEWSTPSFGNVINDKLVVFDLNERKYVLADMENLYQDISNPSSIKKIDVEANRLNLTNNNQIIVADFIDETYPFKMLTKDKPIPFGKYPFNEKITNAIERLQGHVLIHPKKNLMLYGTIDNPYLSLYSINDNSTKLLWENQFEDPDYTITNGVLSWGKNKSSGIFDICFTKDYIVCLIADTKSIKKKAQMSARGTTMEVPFYSIYLFDYQGSLSHIFDLQVCAIRLAGNIQSNVIYLVAIPDFSIITYDLSDYGL